MSSSHAINLIEEPMKFVKMVCYYQADNISDRKDRPDLDQSNQERSESNMLGTFLNKERERKQGDSGKIHLLSSAETALSLRMGRCAEQSHLLACYLLAKRCDDFKFVCHSGHLFVVTSFPKESDLLSPETIPPEAMVIDPWMDESYPAKQYADREKKMVLNGKPKIVEWQSYYPESEHMSIEKIQETCRSLIVDYISKNVGRNRLPDLPSIDGKDAALFGHFNGYTIAELHAVEEELGKSPNFLQRLAAVISEQFWA